MCAWARASFVNVFSDRAPCILCVLRARNSYAVFVLVYMYVDMNSLLRLATQAQTVWHVCAHASVVGVQKAFYV